LDDLASGEPDERPAVQALKTERYVLSTLLLETETFPQADSIPDNWKDVKLFPFNSVAASRLIILARLLSLTWKSESFMWPQQLYGKFFHPFDKSEEEPKRLMQQTAFKLLCRFISGRLIR
jgi:hypothetical protein